MNYAIRHVTRFSYESPVAESVMELRMQPRSEGTQRCLQFALSVQPRVRLFAYRDVLGNWVHHFDIPRRHAQLAVTARSVVHVASSTPMPRALDAAAWAIVDEWAARGEYWDFRQPSQFAVWSAPLVAYANAIGLNDARALDPVAAVRRAMTAMHRDLEYAPNATRVDSPIDEALAARRGVCQDFAHVLLAMLRRLDLPCRYVSGYIAPSAADADLGVTAAAATHAWIEVLLPEQGWVGFDPTHNLEAGVRHVRVAVGRDYADVPPTRGVFKGGAASTLAVSVEVSATEAIPPLDEAPLDASLVSERPAPDVDAERERAQQMQQQQ